jgi:NodT family efflux transporter outer membrane factor (OMF) lipoprotein
MGDVASTYFNVLNTRQRLDIADANLKNARDVLKIVDARYQAGTVSALDLAQQEASLSVAEAARATTAQNVSIAENALAVLLGQVPQTLDIKGDSLNDVNVPAIDPGQPSALLERRPDIRKSEMDLISADADIGVARAALFPTITLGLDGSLATAGFGDPTTTALSLASALAAPIFQGGRLEGGVEQATARQKELVENYRKTVLVSLQEVENALTAEKTAARREGHLAKAAQESRKAYKYARQQYEAGVIDFQTLLETQTTQLLSEDSHAQSRNERLQASVDLFKALGGGWAILEKH